MGLTLLDAGVIIGYLSSADPHHETATKALREAIAGNQSLAMPASVLAEILVGPSRRGADAVEVVRNMVAAVPIAVIPIGNDIAVKAADVRARHKSLKLPDALVIATAEEEGAERLLTTDRRWPSARRLGISTKLQVL